MEAYPNLPTGSGLKFRNPDDSSLSTLSTKKVGVLFTYFEGT